MYIKHLCIPSLISIYSRPLRIFVHNMPAMAHILYSVHSTHWPHFNPLRIFVHNMPAMANIPYSVHSTHWPHFNPLRIPFGFISMLALPLRFAFSTGNLFCQLCNLYSPAHCKEHWREHTVTHFFLNHQLRVCAAEGKYQNYSTDF